MKNVILFHELIVSDDQTVLIITSNNDPIGQVTYSKKDNTLYNLLVDKYNRNYGYGTKLLKEAVRRYSPKYITASSGYGSDVIRLVRLYEKCGFSAYEVRMSR